MVAREVSGGAADDRTFDAAFCISSIVVVAMTSANAVLPRIVFMQELPSCQSNPWAVNRFLDPPKTIGTEALEAAKALGERTIVASV